MRSKNIFLAFIVIVFSFFIVELGLRFFGYKPFQLYFLKVKEIKPETCMRKDFLIGFSLKPGNFIFDYVSDYSFEVNHNSEGYRICSESLVSDTLRKINFYGGSLFYGFGLNDSLTFPWKIQNEFENFKVSNYAIFGHNPATMLVQLTNQIKNKTQPDIAVITYANYNSKRVVYSNSFKRSLYANKKYVNSDYLDYLYARVEGESLILKQDKFYFQPYFSADKFAFVNLLENSIENYYDNKLEEEKVHILVLEKIIKLCLDNSIKPIFFAVRTGVNSVNELNQLENLGASVIISKVDYKINNDFNLLPYDNHPNSNATTTYKDELSKFIKEKNL